MRIDVFLSAAEVDAAAVDGRACAVIDVIRATSTMVEALTNGATAIYPTASAEEALKLAQSLGREETLLCGERRGLKIEGFDLGNSPAEYTPEVVREKRLVMSTTNGTRAFVAAATAERIVSAAFMNLGAVAHALADEEAVAVVCAGKEDRFSLDDAVCAGALVARLEELSGEPSERNDAAWAALDLWHRHGPVDAAFLARTAAGAALVEVGLEGDLPLCAAMDRHDRVPEMHDRVIRLGGEED